jgi:hypothetical protein
MFFVKKRDPRLHPTIKTMLNKVVPIFEVRDNKKRRFDIVVRNEYGASADLSLTVELGDDWDDVRVAKI